MNSRDDYNTVMRDEESSEDNKAWHIYVLRCSDGSLYTGVTIELVRRLRQHNGELGGRCALYPLSAPSNASLVFYSADPQRGTAYGGSHQVALSGTKAAFNRRRCPPYREIKQAGQMPSMESRPIRM